jgi:hypothetical protein
MWAKTLTSLTLFLWDIYREPPSQFALKYQSWYLTRFGPLLTKLKVLPGTLTDLSAYMG